MIKKLSRIGSFALGILLYASAYADPYQGLLVKPTTSPRWWNAMKKRADLDTSAYQLPSGMNLKEIKVSGKVRFLTIYRDMDKSYGDMITNSKNFSFVDYPLTNIGSNNNGGYPMLELNFASNPLSKFQFSVGYSFTSSLTGQTADTAGSRAASARQNLRFGGKWSSGPVKVSVEAGNLWARISRFTIGAPEYRDNYFDRVPWDWYRNSFLRYEEYYGLNTNIGAEAAGNTPLIGFSGTTEILPWGVKIKGVYGRTNRSTSQAKSIGYYPSYTSAVRVEKNIFTRRVQGRVGVNLYQKKADTDFSRGIPDDIQIVSGDFSMKVYKVKFSSEVGVSELNNPMSKNKQGFGAVFKTEIDRSISPIPVSLELYHIDVNMASIDGSVLNSNRSVNEGGYGTEFIYDSYQMINFAQQVGQLANNRQGFSFLGEGNIKKLKIQLGLSASQELQNISDTITFQHRVNSFSRSRFRPWFQAGGNYKRIKSFWLTTFETLSITDSVINNYKKGFNTVELFLKYKGKFLGKDFVVLNFNNVNSIQKSFSLIPKFNDGAYIRTFFEDLTVSYRIGKRYTFVGNVGFERAWGNKDVNLADENGLEIKNAQGRPTYNKDGKTIDQLGRALGVGFDYDFSNNAGIHIRHKWMDHKDKNFKLDEFRGTETYLELVVFF